MFSWEMFSSFPNVVTVEWSAENLINFHFYFLNEQVTGMNDTSFVHKT